MIDRRLVLNFDWILFILTICISAIGVVTIYSAVYTDDMLSRLYLKQMSWIGYGLIAMFIVIVIDYHILAKWIYLAYAVMIVLLIYLLIFGKVISGAQRWLSFGGITLQISEFAKIIVIILLAKFFEDKPAGPYNIKDMIYPLIFVTIPFLLIVKQPDLGTALLVFAIFTFTALIMGIERKTLIVIISAMIILVPVAWFYYLKDYQKMRVLTLFKPDADPLGVGYHTLQAKIAIGSGGLTGKGLLQGTQSRLNFLPERHTDFIFGILAEESGFLGCIILILLYILFIFKAVLIATNCKEKLGAIISIGIVVMFSISFLVNIGMAIGILPVVGVPLPFMSYGGSSMIVNLMAIGILINIDMRKFRYE